MKISIDSINVGENFECKTAQEALAVIGRYFTDQTISAHIIVINPEQYTLDDEG